jgi:hypothetical protein
VQAESASLEVARSVLVGVGVLAGARARDSQTASAGVSRSRKASLRRPMARPSRADASSALEPS